MQLKLSLIVPVYNEAGHLAEFLRLIDGLNFPVEKELVIIDDGSHDGSTEILKNFPFASAHRILWHKKNCGKGGAIHTGLSEATGDFIVIHDADLEYTPTEIPALLAPLIAGTADCVFGTRFAKGRVSAQPLLHYVANKLLTLMSNFLTGLELTDMETCYKVMRGDLLRNIRLKSLRFGFEPEITAKIARLNVRLVELPVTYRPRTYKGGKKIGWLDGVSALWHIIRFNVLSLGTDWVKAGMPQRYLPKR